MIRDQQYLQTELLKIKHDIGNGKHTTI